MCIGGQGVVVPAGSVIPPHAQLAYYSDRNLRLPDKVTATIGGAAVKVTNKSAFARPFNVLVTEIDSDRTGELVLTYENHAQLKYTVKAIAMPRQITGVIGRGQGPA